MRVLIIGGTRNMGHFLAKRLHEDGHTVTVLNRGITRDELPPKIERLQADRTVPAKLEEAIAGRTWDAVVDFVLYNASEAQVAVDLFDGKTGHYVFVSSGQVYLLRKDAERPFSEDDYDGALIEEPPLNTYDHEEWSYGRHKRGAEDVLARAWAERTFPVTTLRLPMVNGERDPFNRLYAYILRLKDAGPILVPDAPDHPLRHIYSGDVVAAIQRVLGGTGAVAGGQVYNLSQEETLSLQDFLALLGAVVGIEPRIIKVERGLLEANGFLPDCSPFSDVWMSELDNRRSKQVLGVRYTPLREYLGKLVAHYEAEPPHQPTSYRRRHAERQFVANN